MKSSFGGWQNWHTFNLYAYVCSCYGEGADDIFSNNTCVAKDGGGCYFWPTYASDAPTRNGLPPANFKVGDNAIYATKPIMVGAHGNLSLEQWVALGHDAGTTAHPLPSDAVLAQRVRKLLHAGLLPHKTDDERRLGPPRQLLQPLSPALSALKPGFRYSGWERFPGLESPPAPPSFFARSLRVRLTFTLGPPACTRQRFTSEPTRKDHSQLRSWPLWLGMLWWGGVGSKATMIDHEAERLWGKQPRRRCAQSRQWVAAIPRLMLSSCTDRARGSSRCTP